MQYHIHTMDDLKIYEATGSKYNDLPYTRPRSFLSLPKAVRLRIYYKTGIVPGHIIILNKSSPFPPPRWALGGRSRILASAPRLDTPYNLLLTSRMVYLEVSSILYSENSFFIRYSHLQSLQVLRNLNPYSISHLTELTVHLNVTSCELDHPCCGMKTRSYLKCSLQHDSPLSISVDHHKAILSEWQSTIAFLKPHIEPRRLKIHLVCDVENTETATSAVEPFLDIPILAACSIRLSKFPSPALRGMAERAAFKAVAYEALSSFRFLDLPWELRQQILEYTDLVAPFREVEWNPENGFHHTHATFWCSGDFCSPSKFHHACQFRSCWQRSKVNCFCRRYHAAFSTDYKCKCWCPPTALFLLCHTLQEEAQAVFFKKNRFIITPSKGCKHVVKETPPRLEICIFLTKVVPAHALGFLTYLEIVFPPFDGDYLREEEPAYRDWLDTIKYIEDKLYLPTLIMRVYMADHTPQASDTTTFRGDLSKEQGRVVWRMYLRTIFPLSRLRGLRRLFVHVAWPLNWTPNGMHIRMHRPGGLRRFMEGQEREIENRTMGCIYDDTLLKKSEQPMSQWERYHLDRDDYQYRMT